MVDISNIILPLFLIGSVFTGISFYFCYKISKILGSWKNLIGILIGLIALSLSFRVIGISLIIDPQSFLSMLLFSGIIPFVYSIGMAAFSYKLYKAFKALKF